MEIKDYLKNCVDLYSKSKIITKGIKKSNQFEEFDNITELNNSYEVYSYKNINNAVGYFNKNYIEIKNDIIFDELELKSLKNGKIPFILTYNIITLRFLNYNLNTKNKIKILIGFFYSNFYNIIEQLYLNGIDDYLILKYFNIDKNFNYIENEEYNIFYNKTQLDFYKTYKNRIHHKYQMWLKNDKIKDDINSILPTILDNIKKNKILISIFKQILKTNNKISKDDYKQFIILNISDKIKKIKSMINIVPNYVSSESIYSLIIGEMEKYDTTITLDFIDNFLKENDIKLIKKLNIDEIVNNITMLIKQGRYLKNKTKEICEYLKISEKQFDEIINKYNISKPENSGFFIFIMNIMLFSFLPHQLFHQ
jgi:hypothetical protein